MQSPRLHERWTRRRNDYWKDPAFEQQECINKANALFGVAEEAKRFASAVGRGQ